MDFFKKLGLNIKKLREDKNFTQARLAELSETSVSTIARLELAEGFATSKTFQNIAKALQTDLETLFNVSGIVSDGIDYDTFIEQLKIDAKKLKTQEDFNFILTMIKSYSQTLIKKEK